MLSRLRERARTRGTTAVLVGSALSGLGAYLFQVLGTRALGEVDYAPIGVLWTLQYLVFTVGLVSVEAYVTRGVMLDGARPAVTRPILAWIGALTVVVAGVSTLLRESLFGSSTLALPAVAGLTVVGFGAFVVVRGGMAGRHEFSHYGVATGAESLVRLAAAALVLTVTTDARVLAFTLPAGTLTVVTVWWSSGGRRARAPASEVRDEVAGPSGAADPVPELTGAVPTAADLPPLPADAAPLVAGSAASYLAATTLANAVSQSLLAAGPLVVIALGAGPEVTSIVFVTITVARAPLVFAFGGLLSRVLPPLVRLARTGQRDRLWRLALRIGLVVLTLAAAAAPLGATVAPPLLGLLFGAQFTPSAAFAAVTAAGVVMATGALGLNQLLIAMGAERRLVVPWLLALVGGLAAVAAGGQDPALRAGLGTLVGQAVAVAGLLLAVRHAPLGEAAATVSSAAQEPDGGAAA